MKPCMHLPPLPHVLSAHPSHPPWFDHTNNTWWVQISKLLTIQFFFPPASCYYIPKPNILFTFPSSNNFSIPIFERPSFTSGQNNRQNYSYVRFEFGVLERKRGTQNILNYYQRTFRALELLSISSCMQLWFRQGMLGATRCRTFCLPVCYPKI